MQYVILNLIQDLMGKQVIAYKIRFRIESGMTIVKKMQKTKIILVIALLLTGLIYSNNYTSAQQATSCASLGGTCRPATLCGTGVGIINGTATDCGTNFCCVPSTPVGTSCSSLGNTCRSACQSGENIRSGNFYDCTGGNNLCCERVGPVITPNPSTPPSTPNPTETPSPGAGQSNSFPNPISANNATELLKNILNSLRGVVAIIAIIFIIIGGIMYMTAAGSEKMIDKAKATITGAVVGLAIVLAAPAFLKQILEILGGTDASGELSDALTIKQLAENVLKFLLSITGIIAIISLIVGGSFYLTAYGDEERIEKGKTIIKYSIIGIAVAAAALVIVKQLAGLIGMAP